VGLAQLEDIQLNNIQADAAVLSGGTMTITNGGSPVAAIAVAGTYPGGFTVNHTAFYGNTDAASSFIRAVACFAAGTRIATPNGGVAVESLRPGDLVLLARGGAARVQWLGHRHVDCRRHPRRHDVLPVRVRAHAFGPDLPARDLLLSPDHSVHVDGMLIPVRHLINGRTIAQEAVAEITYHHVELLAHDVLLAEGLPCETYLETGNRAAFADDDAAIVSAM
jgi:collagen type I alpha